MQIGLAPMEGVTDFPYRRWLSLCSRASFHSTPFLRVTDQFPHRELPTAFAPEVLDPDYRSHLDTPLLCQLMGPSPERIASAARLLLHYTDTFDVNFGCPAPTVVGKGSGSSLLKDPRLFQQFVTKITQLLPEASFSIKIRTGYDSDENFYELIAALERIKLEKLTVHGRTKAQKYSGFADWDLIEHAAKTLPFPVFGSGDIVDHQSLVERINIAPSVKNYIVGRGVLRNPWIFDEIKSSDPKPRDPIRVLLALLIYGCYIELFYERGYETFKKIDFLTEASNSNLENLQEWELHCHKILNFGFNLKSIDELLLGRRAFARIKMLWTYLKNDMPKTFDDRSLLRSKSVNEFINIYRSLMNQDDN